MFRSLYAFGFVICLWIAMPVSAAEIVVLTNDNWDRYAPPGKEADCILGDFVLKSDRVWAVVAQPATWRHANMTVRQVGGGVIDLTTVERPNDQLSAFYPGMRRHVFTQAKIVQAKGEVVRLLLTAPAQEARPATKEQAAAPAQPEVQLVYELADGSPCLVLRSTFKNTLSKPLEFSLEDDLRADDFDAKSRNAVHDLFWIHDRYFEQAYGVVADGHKIKSQSDAKRVSRLEYLKPGAESARLTLAPGGTHELVRKLVPGPHLLAVKGDCAQDQAKLAPFKLEVLDAANAPVAGADVMLKSGDEDYGTGKTDASGRLTALLSPGQYTLTVRAVGRGTQSMMITLPAPATGGRVETLEQRVALPSASVVEATITDSKGGPIPCKVQFKGLNGTTNPNWGPPAAREAVTNLYYTHTGRFSVPINPGEYEAIVSYGPEYDIVRVPLKVTAGARVPLKAALRRAVQSPGWVSADFHSHSSPSGDNTGDQRGRVLNLLCEHIEYAPCTEHNRIDSYTPHLKALGMEKLLGTCTGIELTGTPLPLNHHNAFPLKMKPRTQDNGAPLTDVDPQKQIRRLAEWDDKADKLIQQNHPDIGWLFFDKDGDGSPDRGYEHGFGFMNVIEVHPIHDVLSMKPTRQSVDAQGKRITNNDTIFNWLQLLNQGYKIHGVVNTDAHYNFHGSGGLRNWVRCDCETPGDIQPDEIVRHAKAGHMVMSTGPFMEVQLGNALPGDEVRLKDGRGTLHVKVQCPNWFDIDRVQVLVNGRPDPKLNFTRKDQPARFGSEVVKFDQKIDLQLDQDAHIIVVAIGEESLIGEVMGPMWGRQNPVAMSNPIFVDVDGGGFKASADTLGHPLPVKGGK